MQVSFRPHHFLCNLGFRGLGYSPSFVRNYQKINNALKNDPNIKITVTFFTDDICGACPNKIDEINCNFQEKILALDAKHAEILKLQHGDQISWKDAKNRLKNFMSVEKFHLACADCEWKKLGVCQESLEDLINS